MSRQRHRQALFVDTSAYFAAVDRDDENHALATMTMQHLANEPRLFVTTNVVLIELHALLVNRINRQTALLVLKELLASQRIVRIGTIHERRALEIMTDYTDKDFSYADALSFAVMERLSITTAFCFDRHFQQFGWQVIPDDG
jgi:predicted nucleic acid-binding protein